MSIEKETLSNIIQAALLAFGQPLSMDRLMSLFSEDEQVSRQDIREVLQQLQQACDGQGIELVEVGSGFRYQACKDYAQWVAKLWEEKPPRYSRALLETLVLVAYRQPITRAEIEDIRGVSVSTHIMKTLQERDWVRIVGHKDVPGKPALYATTKAFLDYFNLKSLDELPSLMEIRDLDKISAEIDKQRQDVAAEQAEANTQELMDEVDVERLLPDGDADHGDGFDDSVEGNIEGILAVQQEAISTEAIAETTLSEDETTLSEDETTLSEEIDALEMTESVASGDEQGAMIEDTEHAVAIVDVKIADSSEFDSVATLDSAPLAEVSEYDSEESSSEYEDNAAIEVPSSESEYTENAHKETDNVHAESESESTQEAGFSTAKYGLRPAEQVEAASDEIDYEDEDEHDHHSNRYSAAEPNT